MEEKEPGGSGKSFKETKEVPRADEPAEWKLSNWTFIEDQSVSREAVACSRKAWSYASQTLPEKWR